MRTVRIALLVLPAVFLSNGCGTIRNLRSGDPDVYGGVKKDVEFIQTPGSGGGPELLVIMAAETGLSLIADTLTLPLVVRMRQNEQTSDDKAQPTSDEAGKSR